MAGTNVAAAEVAMEGKAKSFCRWIRGDKDDCKVKGRGSGKNVELVFSEMGKTKGSRWR